MRNPTCVLLALIFSTGASSQPQWPDFVDVDLNYRSSAQRSESGWDFRAGLGFETEPTYQGSDENETETDLFLLAAWRDDWGNISLLGDGIGYSRLIGEQFGMLLQLEAEDSRQEDDDQQLRGLGDQDQEVELEIVGQYFIGPWRLGASVALATGDKGTVWFIGAGHTWRLADGDLFLTLSSDLSGSDADNQQTDFGITPSQSAASEQGFPEYDPSGGLKSFGLRLLADYEIDGNWYIYGEVDYERLLGDVADSPLVRQGGSTDNYEAAIAVYYKFD